ncbi:MAG: DUF2520 domain-containing protein [Gammaproteobacteria bacterium]|nr:DUF2520 domain-containing protein [Gammaproteobacteria bacterium]
MTTLNIIGAGKLGSTLAHLWHRQQIFQIGGICNRSLSSGKQAQVFIGAGTVYPTVQSLPDADCWLIASSDSSIEPIAKQLATRLAEDKSAATIFHCSGALAAECLQVCKLHSKISLASAHPAHSFADPQTSINNLASSTVALEGETRAIGILKEAFNTLGCQTITLDSQQKVLYHAGSVIACNYLTVLIDLSLQSFAAAGIDEGTARRLLQPLMLQTLNNTISSGPVNALTGPIARGDSNILKQQLNQLKIQDTLLQQCYRSLGLACVQLATRKGLPAEKSQQLTKLLDEQKL